MFAICADDPVYIPEFLDEGLKRNLRMCLNKEAAERATLEVRLARSHAVFPGCCAGCRL